MIHLTTGTLDALMASAQQLEQSTHYAAAADVYRQVLSMHPAHAEAKYRLGVLVARLSGKAAGISLIRESLLLQPDSPLALRDLGRLLMQSGQPAEAAQTLQRTTEISPQDEELHNALAIARHMAGDVEGALATFRRAIALNPKAEMFSNLAISLQVLGRVDEALAANEDALRLNPPLHTTLANQAALLQACGQPERAVEYFRHSLAVAANPVTHSTLLFTLHFVPGISPAEIAREEHLWAARYADPLTARAPQPANDRSPDRPLRIGYVSADFCDHPVGRMVLPWLSLHDRSHVHVTCYSSVHNQDAMTARLQKSAQQWRGITALNDQQAADQIRQDKIDILIDLGMHTSGGRPLLFARRPAPVQVAYLAYLGSTGMRAMDYRLSHPAIDPPGVPNLDAGNSEKTFCLPHTYWCYAAPEAAEHIPLRTEPSKDILFGCMNNVGKVSAPALETWGHILAALPESRILLHCAEGSGRTRIQGHLARQGVSPDRISFQPRLAMPEYFATLAGIDIALDPFPYAGGTTSCDTLWMGTPFITLRGKMATGRGGVSLLTTLGYPDLIAESPEQYVAIAVALTRDRARLTDIRRTVRDRMRHSPIMDAPAFTRDLEHAYRQMWRTWCAGSPA